MSRKEFVLDIIINKLNLKDDKIQDTKDLLAKFTFGDIRLDITTDRVNVADFGEGRSVEFKSTLNALKKKLQDTPLELTLINPAAVEKKDEDKAKEDTKTDDVEKKNEADPKTTDTDKKDSDNKKTVEKIEKKDQSKSDKKDDEDEGKEDKSVEEDDKEIRKSEENDKHFPKRAIPANVVGIVSLKWPPALIDRLTDHCTAVVPHIQVCDIKRGDENVGSITLGIMLHCKCEEKFNLSRNKLPYMNEQGILTAFQEARKELEKNDVFFVIGRDPEPCDILADGVYQEKHPCSGRQKYPVQLDTSRYKLIRGTLVKDCSKLAGVCGEQDCCVNWYDPEKEPVELCPETRKKKPRCTCQDIFGNPSGDMSTRRSMREIKSGSMTERRSSRMTERRSSMSRRGSIKQAKPDPPAKDEIVLRDELQQILAQRLEQYQREEEEISRPPDTKNILPPRFCPKCCENLTMYPKRAPCPKCGYKLSSKRIYEKDETADDILNRWNPEEKEFLETKGFSKFDHCTCHERGDQKFKRKCLYCRIRDIRNEVTDYGPPEESLLGPPKARILSNSDLTKETDEDICEKIIREYADDEVLRRSKMWQEGEGGPPRLSVIMDMFKRVLPPTQTGFETVSKGSAKPQKDQPRKSIQQKRKSMSMNEKIFGKKIVRAAKDATLQLPGKPKNVKEFMNQMKRKYGRRYIFTKRRQTKQIIIQHTECIPESHAVPPNMGWLWNLDERAVKRGWRPGKISRPIRELMAYFLTDFPVDTLPTTQEIVELERPPLEPESEEELVQKPTLRIQKQDGQYLITMNPLKTETELKYSADPYAKADPIQFKISKDPMDMKRRQIKRYLKDIGFRKCTCKQPATKCDCRTYMEKERLDNSLKYICEMVQATSVREAVCLSDTTESDSHLNIEFTPPAGVIKPHLKTKPDIAEDSTQYDVKDYNTHFIPRTEEVIRSEIKKKKRHSCAGPIQSIPCHFVAGVDKFKKKGKKGTGDKKGKNAAKADKKAGDNKTDEKKTVVKKPEAKNAADKKPADTKGKK